MKITKLLILAISLIVAFSCKTKNKTSGNLAPNVHKVTSQEVIQSTNYTYLRVSEDGKESWIAIARQEVAVGKSYYYEPSIEMTDFTSKELQRTFPSIIFVAKFSETPIVAAAKYAVADPPKGKQAAIAKEGLKVARAANGITIAELNAQKGSYAGKKIKIKGEVVKYNPQIMGKNWLHIQDGSTNNGVFDLTITTTEEVKIGDVVTFEGIVALNKDFGAGYSYDVIVEEGKLLP
jgi:GW (Gly-Tryp) dipeptide domain